MFGHLETVYGFLGSDPLQLVAGREAAGAGTEAERRHLDSWDVLAFSAVAEGLAELPAELVCNLKINRLEWMMNRLEWMINRLEWIINRLEWVTNGY